VNEASAVTEVAPSLNAPADLNSLGPASGVHVATSKSSTVPSYKQAPPSLTAEPLPPSTQTLTAAS